MSGSECESWISWFCGLPENEFFCEINEEYIIDKFNLTGLNEIVPKYKEAMKLILDEETDETDGSSNVDEIEKYAQMLYGLIHARYIVTAEGMRKMVDKWKDGHFGKCPSVYCHKQLCLPIGLHSDTGHASVKLFCPSCNNIYNHRSNKVRLDGAYFGPDFPQMLFVVNPEMRPMQQQKTYVPKLFGFKIHPLAYLQN